MIKLSGRGRLSFGEWPNVGFVRVMWPTRVSLLESGVAGDTSEVSWGRTTTNDTCSMDVGTQISCSSRKSNPAAYAE